MPSVRNPDPFNAVLLESPPLVVTFEQQELVKKVLSKACSDSRFADKAYVAISRILSGATVRPPTVTSLVPSTMEVGDPSVTLHVHGTNFSNTSKIIFNGFEEPTTFVSATELTTGINMDVWLAPAVVPVMVESNGILSDSMNFTFTDGTPAGLSLSGPGVRGKVILGAKAEEALKPKVENELPESMEDKLKRLNREAEEKKRLEEKR